MRPAQTTPEQDRASAERIRAAADVTSPRRNYHTLDGLRGIAAVTIVILHTPHFFGWWKPPGSFLALDLFFVLSGFVLSAVYQPRFQAGMTAVEFLRIRFIRLYPLYILGTIIGIPVALLAMRFGQLSIPWSPTLLLTSLPLSAVVLPTPKVGPVDALYPFCPVLWSIFFELLANVAYVMCWRFISTAKNLVTVIGLSGATLISYGLRNGTLDAGFSWGTFGGGVPRVIFSFFFGVLICHSLKGKQRRESPLALGMIGILVVIFLLPANVILELISILILFPAMVAVSSIHEPGARVQRIFNILGVTSYAIYTVHKPLYQLALGMLKRVLPMQPESLAPWIGILYIPLLIGLCTLIDRIYDVPLRRVLSGRRAKVSRVAVTLSRVF